jgi:hypothetical protein
MNKNHVEPAVDKTTLLAELRQDLAAIEAYQKKHGSFSEMARAHYLREKPRAS